MRSRTWIGLALGWAVGCAIGVSQARTPITEFAEIRPCCSASGPHAIRPPVEIDPLLPKGAPFAAQRERPHSIGAACSATASRVCATRRREFRAPKPCVRCRRSSWPTSASSLALSLPAPLADDGHGGSDALDWYLSGESHELASERDALGLGALDRAAAFCVSAASDDALALERSATLCVGEAIAKRLDPGEVPAIQRAFASELWWLTGSIGSLDVQAVDDSQAHPERALVARSAASSAAATLLFDFLESARSSQASGGLVTSLLSAAASTTPAGAFEWNNEPDVFDVLRHSLDEDSGKTAALLG